MRTGPGAYRLPYSNHYVFPFSASSSFVSFFLLVVIISSNLELINYVTGKTMFKKQNCAECDRIVSRSQDWIVSNQPDFNILSAVHQWSHQDEQRSS